MRRQSTSGNGRRRRIWLALGILALLVAMTGAWKWSPLADQIDIRKIIRWAVALRQNPARGPIVLAAYLVGSMISFPVTLLILATAFVFGPIVGSAYSFAGCLLGAAATYAMGYFMGKDLVQRLAGRRWARAEKKIAPTGVVAVAAVRLLPIAPFTIVNVVSGALKVPLRDYALGSILGLAPGILLINFFAHQFVRAIRHPGAGSYALLAASLALAALGFLWIRRKLAAVEK